MNGYQQQPFTLDIALNSVKGICLDSSKLIRLMEWNHFLLYSCRGRRVWNEVKTYVICLLDNVCDCLCHRVQRGADIWGIYIHSKWHPTHAHTRFHLAYFQCSFINISKYVTKYLCIYYGLEKGLVLYTSINLLEL